MTVISDTNNAQIEHTVGYLVRVVNNNNKDKLSFIALPIKLNFGTLFDFNTLY